jgi:glutamate formiminotransferase/glutamate formiminotransferase/formiminotetrahydrofolate cyclodeaminase
MSKRLHALVLADVEAYESVARTRKISKERPERAGEFEAAMQRATETPMEIAELACQAGLLISTCRPSVKAAVQSDLTVGIIMAVAATEAGLHTVKENIKLIKNHIVKEVFTSRVCKTTQSLEELKGLC